MFEGSRVKNIDTRKAPVKIPFAIHELEITLVAGSVTLHERYDTDTRIKTRRMDD